MRYKQQRTIWTRELRTTLFMLRALGFSMTLCAKILRVSPAAIENQWRRFRLKVKTTKHQCRRSERLRLQGRRFGWLKVRDYFGTDSSKSTLWACVCDCGGAVLIKGTRLALGKVRSCGCNRAHKGRYSTGASLEKFRRTHGSYAAMKSRCLNPNLPNYQHYGGRGIKICDRWLVEGGFTNFVKDMGIRPANKSLDRIDVNGNYEPSNCRWATSEVQVNNRRCSPRNKAKLSEMEARIAADENPY